MIFVKLLLLFLVLSAVLYLLARFLHGMLYTEIPADLHWRAPAAAAVVCLAGPVLAAVFNSAENTAWPIAFTDLFMFSTGRTEVEFKAFELPGGRRFDRQLTSGGRVQYRDAQGPLPTTPEALVGITSDGQKVKLTIKKDSEGHIDRSQGVRYVDPDGREMTEEQFGAIVSSHSGPVFFTLFVILLSAGVWFACWWLLLKFQWPQALGLALASFLLWAATLCFAW